MTNDESIPAFPFEFKYGDGTAMRTEGMTLRDYFAAKAMQALISAHANDTCGVYSSNPIHWATKEAYQFADAMLEARK